MRPAQYAVSGALPDLCHTGLPRRDQFFFQGVERGLIGSFSASPSR
jgi:hypothetical protein